MIAKPALSLHGREPFMTALARSLLLSEKQYQNAVANLPESARTAQLAADHLVRVGTLTKFQADRVLAGKTDGYVLGSYQILEPLGKGAAAKVFKARHRSMNRLVAIKILSAAQTNTPESKAAFHREMRAASPLVHPHIVTAYDTNELQNRMYVVLEYVHGATLESIVREQGPIPLTDACLWIRQAALGLAEAHARNVTHGAINPTNLLLSRPEKNGRASSADAVKILNFGLARLPRHSYTSNLTAAAAVLDYSAPELLSTPTDFTPASDLFSLGQTLLYLLSGRPPVEAPMPPDAPLDAPKTFVPIDQLQPSVPPSVSALIAWATAANPKKRPANAAEFIARLDELAKPNNHSGAVQFALPTPSPTDSGNMQPSQLSGLTPPLNDGEPADSSPFADLTSDELAEDAIDTIPANRRYDATASSDYTSVSFPTPINTRTNTRLALRSPKAERRWVLPATIAMIGGVILLTGMAVGAVLRAVMR